VIKCFFVPFHFSNLEVIFRDQIYHARTNRARSILQLDSIGNSCDDPRRLKSGEFAELDMRFWSCLRACGLPKVASNKMKI